MLTNSPSPAELPPAAANVPADEPHGTPDRTDGTVETRRESNGRWIATQLVTIRNGYGDATQASLEADTFNGAIRTLGFDGGGYLLEASLYAHGATETEARERLAELELQHSDEKTGPQLTLTTELVVPDPTCSIEWICPSVATQGDRGATLLYALPQRASHGLGLDTSNGAILVQDLQGSTLQADTSNGAISMDGAWDSVDLSSSNGRITAKVATGKDTGYDIEASTSNGQITLDVDDTQSVGEQTNNQKHVRTNGYDDRDHRIGLSIDTSNSSVTVTG